MLEDSYHYFPFVNLDTLSPHSVTSWSAWWQRRPDNKVREERGQVLPGLKPTILSMVTLGTYRAMTQKLRKGTSPHSSSEKLQNKDRKPCVAEGLGLQIRPEFKPLALQLTSCGSLKEPFKPVLSHSVVSDSFPPFRLYPARLLYPWEFSGKNTGVGCHFLLQGIFLTQGSNLHLLGLLHYRQILYLLGHQGRPSGT